MKTLDQVKPATLRDLRRAFQANQPVGIHVDALYEIRKAMRTLRRIEKRLAAEINREKRNVRSTKLQK